MELTAEEHAVLKIFKEHDIEEGEYLTIQTLDRERLGLPKKVQNNWNDILKALRSSGYIVLDPLGCGLTEKGYRYLHPLP